LGTYRYYLLEGIAGRNLGIQIPGFRDFFNFSVGDVFQYHTFVINYGIGDGMASLAKKTILSKDSSSSGFSYEMQVSEMWWHVSLIGSTWDTTHFYYLDTAVYIDSSNHYCNLYPHELARNVLASDNLGPLASTMKIFKDTGQVISRLAGVDFNFPPDEQPAYTYGGIDTLVTVGDILEYAEKYTAGIGRVKYDVMVFESRSEEDLIGYVKNGDTTGIVYPDDFLLQGVPESTNNDGIKIFPNPAIDLISIRLPRNGMKNANIELLTLEGQIVMSKTFPSPGNLISIKISDLPKALYLIKVTTDKESVEKKLIVR